LPDVVLYISHDTLLRKKPVQQEYNGNGKYNPVYELVVFCQPVGQKNIKVVPAGVRIPAGYNGKGANHFKRNQYNTFQQHQYKANPNPFVNFIYDNCIKQVIYHHIKKHPDDGVDGFYDVELCFGGHKFCNFC
jgi:hypothetical protein